MLSERYTVFPIKYHNLWEYYKKQLALFWTVEEIKLNDDLTDFNNLTKDEQFFLKNVLAFFASSDGIVNENLLINFYNEIEIAEARNFYASQALIEAVHNEMYSILIDTYITDVNEKNELFSAIETNEAIKVKADWCMKWITEGSGLIKCIPEHEMAVLKKMSRNYDKNSEEWKSLNFITKDRPSIEQRLLCFIFIEGIFFSGSFCAIYWLKNRNKLPGLTSSNEFIARDENLHASFGIELYLTIANPRLPEKMVHEIIDEAVEIEKNFITKSLPVSLIGMNCTLMCEYIEYVADRWLVMLEYNKKYNAKNPFSFMELISLHSKQNFFEGVNSSYSKSNVGVNAEDREFGIVEDF